MAEEVQAEKPGSDPSAETSGSGGSLLEKWQRWRLAKQAALSQAGGKAGIIYTVITAATATFAVATILLAVFFRPVYLDLRQQYENRHETFAKKCIEQAKSINEDTTNVAELNRAFRYLRLAFDNAREPDTRNEASLVMGEYVLARARQDPTHHAIAARQYLWAVLDVETRPENCIRAYKALIAANYLMKDFNGLQDACKKALELITDNDERSRILLLQIDLCLEKGTWTELQQLLAQAGPLRNNPLWHNEFTLRETMGNEQVLLRNNWFDEWKEDKSRLASESNPLKDAADADKALRAALLEQTLLQFQDMAESGPALLAAEAFFRTGRLYFHEGLYERARIAFGDFLRLEPVIHQADTLLMMTKTARKLGRMPEAEEMISTFLLQFPWGTAAENEFIAVVDEAILQGRLEQALKMIENYSRLPTAKSTLSELLCKAGELATSLGRYEQATDYFERVVTLDTRNDLVVTAMLALVNIKLELNDLDDAREWLLTYLNRFPFEVKQGDALFALIDIDVRCHAAMADILNVAVTAVNECPEDPRTGAALTLVARELEDTGLFALAAEQYNKAVLLHYVQKTNNPEQADDAAAFRAMLGNARCLMKLPDRRHEAGQILRKLCSDTAPGPLRSEALYLWANLALSQDQRTEARRRFLLIGEDESSPETRARASVQLALLDLEDSGDTGEAVARIETALNDLDPSARPEIARSAWQEAFDLLARLRDVDGMQRVFGEAVKNGGLDPEVLSTLNYRLGSMILAEKGVPEFVARMEKNNGVLLANKLEPSADILDLIERARNIETQKTTVGKL